MASRLAFVQYVCDQLCDAGIITYRKMFGEFGLYCDGKFFAVVEDDMLCLKITEQGRTLLPEAPIIAPHAGAHYLYVRELDDRALLTAVVRATCDALPAPKPKQKRKGL